MVNTTASPARRRGGCKDAGQGGDVQRHSAADAIQQRGAEQQFTAAKFIPPASRCTARRWRSPIQARSASAAPGFRHKAPRQSAGSASGPPAPETIAGMGRKAVRAMMMPWIAPACGAWGGFRLWLTTFSFYRAGRLSLAAARFSSMQVRDTGGGGNSRGFKSRSRNGAGKNCDYVCDPSQTKYHWFYVGFAAIKKATDVAFREKPGPLLPR